MLSIAGVPSPSPSAGTLAMGSVAATCTGRTFTAVQPVQRARRTQGAGSPPAGVRANMRFIWRHTERSLRVAAHTRQVMSPRQRSPTPARRRRCFCRIQQSLGGHVNAERQAHRPRRRGGCTTRQEVSSCSRAPLASQKATSSSREVEAASSASSSCCRSHAAGCRNRLACGQGTVYRRHAGETVERREPVSNHMGERMVHPEEPGRNAPQRCVGHAPSSVVRGWASRRCAQGAPAQASQS